MAQRFIEQIDVGGPHQHPAQRHSLPLPLDSSSRKPVEQDRLIPERGGHLVDPLSALAASVYFPVRPDLSGEARFSLTVFCG